MKLLALVVLAVFFFAGCYSTQLTGYWRSSQEPVRRYNKVLVVGMMPDSAMRLRMEAHAAGDLTDFGVPALTSLEGFDASLFLQTEDKDVMQQFKEKGIDGVLTITLVSESLEGFFLPGSLYHLLSDYYSSEYYRLFAPEYYREARKYAWESSFYDVGTGGRVFAIQTVTFDPSSIEAMAHEYGKVMSRELRRHKVISRP